MSVLYNSPHPTKTFNYWLTVFVIFIPILNGLASVTTNYFPPATLNPGFFRIVILILFLLIAYTRAYVPNSTNNFIVGFTIFWILLIPFANNLPLNTLQTPKVIISLLLFPMGYYFINTITKFKSLMVSMLIAWLLFILNFFIGNLFQIGQPGYGRELSELYFGSGGINISKSMAFIYLIVPLFLKLNTNKFLKNFSILLSILALPVIILSLKRSALLGLAIGFLMYLFFTPFKAKIVKGIILVGIVILLASPLYWDTFLRAYEFREQSFAFNDPEFADRESRIGELELVFQKFIEGSVKHKLVGTDLIYNSYLYKGSRMLHTDYMVLLYGTGIIGLIWFFSIYVIIVKKYYSFKTNSQFYREGKATLFALIAVALVISIAGSIGDLNFRSLFTLFAGGLIGTARTLYYKEKMYDSTPQIEQ